MSNSWIKKISIFLLLIIISCNLSYGEEELSPLAKKIHQHLLNVDLQTGTVPKDFILTKNNKFHKLFINGFEIFNGIKDLMATAKKEINFVTYIWTDSEVIYGKRVLTDPPRLVGEGLILAQKNLKENETLTVRFLLNDLYWTAENEKSVINEFRKSLKRWVILGLDLNKIKISVAVHKHKLFGNIHQKYVTVDRKYLIVTGANSQATNNFDQNTWHDMGTLNEGEITQSANIFYRYIWNNAPSFYVCEMENTNPVCKESAKIKFNLSKETFEKIEGGHPIFALPQAPREWNSDQTNSPEATAWKAAIHYAKKSINILTPNINEPTFIKYITEAASRGVKVKIITQKGHEDEITGGPVGNLLKMLGTNEFVAQNYLTDKQLYVFKSPETLYLYNNIELSWYSRDGIKAVFGAGKKISHLKLMIIDDQIVIHGSGNQDVFSWRNAGEFNILIDSSIVAKEINEKIFFHDWNNAISMKKDE